MNIAAQQRSSVIRKLIRRSSLGALLALCSASVHADSVSKFYAHMHGAPVAGVEVDLDDPGVKISVALTRGFPGTAEPFVELARRTECVAAVTGTYFGLKSNLPVGDIVVDGRLRYLGARGTAMALTWTNQISFRRMAPGTAERWIDLETVLGAGPTLVRAGRIELAPRHEGFGDPGLFRMATRCAVGLRGRSLLLIAVKRPVSLSTLAAIMRDLGCSDAMNLDGGTSSALYYRGRVLADPGRSLVNIITVSENVPIAMRTRPAALVRIEEQRQLAQDRFDDGKELEEAGDFATAAAAYEAACNVDLRPEFALAYARAVERFEKTAEIAAAYERVGNAFVERRQLEESIPHFRRSLDIDPGRFDARRKLSEVYRRLGLTAAAEVEDVIARNLELALASPLETSRARASLIADLTKSSSRREAELRVPPPIAVEPQGSQHSRSWNLHFRLPAGAHLEMLLDLIRVRHDVPYTIGIQVLEPPHRLSLRQAAEQFHTGSLHSTTKEFKRAVDNEPTLVTECESFINGRKLVSRCAVARRGKIVYAFTLTVEPAAARRAIRDFDALLDSVRFP